MQIGDVISHYQITGALGAGGMGEVFRAVDTALRREVAIKVLPAEVRQNQDRLTRFRREAHLLASLNHPGIAAIYGFEEASPAPFLVLELVEGETLAERLRRGAIPVTEALELARQIAEGLEAAHERGIVHRDLKPANVKVTHNGVVKILDFGLAKALSADGSISDLPPEVSRSPTMAPSGTRLGVILGTAAYMAPEQARGRAVDRRADIWAFGVMLFEMLSGRRLFAGETVTDTMAAVVTADPDWTLLPRETPAAVRRLLRRCLQKEPRLRLPDIGSARMELSESLSGIGDRDEPGAVPATRGSAARAGWIAGALAAALVAGAAAGVVGARWWAPEPPAAPVARVSLQTPSDLQISRFSPPVISPDGRHVIVAAERAPGSQGPHRGPMLWIRHLDASDFAPLPGTEGADQGFWSPDSRSVAFVAGGHLKRVSLAGAVQVLCTLDSTFSGGGTWSPFGTIVVSKGMSGTGDPNGATLVSVPASGGTPTPLTTVDEASGETGHYWPQFLPGGRHVAFIVFGSGRRGLVVVPVDRPAERRLLIGDVTTAAFASGQMLFVRGDTLLAQRFDESALQLEGEPHAIVGGVDFWVDAGLGMFSASRNGLIVYRPAVSRDSQLVWRGRDGRDIVSVGEPRPYAQLSVSPDERRVAVELPEDQGGNDIWILELSRGVLTRFTFDPADDRDPIWSPDGTELVFSSPRGGARTLFRKGLVDGRTEAPLFETTRDVYPESWTRDGRAILYLEDLPSGRAGWLRSADGRSPPEPIMNSPFRLDELQVSPDGKTVAYASMESGRFEVYLQPLRGRGEKVRVSTEGGGLPKWRGDGRELFYVTPEGMLMAVDVRPGSDAPVGLPKALFQLHDNSPDLDHYVPAADGQRFLVKVPVGSTTGAPLHLLLNWDGEAR